MMRSVFANKSFTYLAISICIVCFILLGRALFSQETPSVSTLQEAPIAIQESSINRAVIVCQAADYSDTPFIKQLRANETVTIPEKSALKQLSREELAMLYHRYTENTQYHCQRMIRLGMLGDGGWDICDEDKFKPRQSECLVYSFGINNDFSFDDAVIAEYDCEVHSFDPSMDKTTSQRSKKNYFYKLGIGAGTQEEEEKWRQKSHDNKAGWEMKTLLDIRKSLHHEQKKISILKMDIELAEWTVLPTMIRSGALDNIQQLLVEFHLNLIYPPAEEGKDTYLMAVSIMKDLYDIGFRIFWTHRNIDGQLVFRSQCKNIERANCHELNFVKVK